MIDPKDRHYILGTGHYSYTKPSYNYTNTIINTYNITDESMISPIDTHLFNTKCYGPHNKSYYQNKEWLNDIY